MSGNMAFTSKTPEIMKSYKVFLLVVLPFTLIVSTKSQNLSFAKTISKDKKSLNMKLINGWWFNGQTFVKRTAWVNQGQLYFKQPFATIDTMIDLANKYVIPPFAEAHNHNLESRYKLQKRIDSYLNNGVFYVKLLSSIKKRIGPLMGHYNKPDGIDVSMAHAPLTATGGHPIGVRKRYLKRGHFRGLFNTLKDIESHGYFVINDSQDLQNKWKQILSFGPDFIKLNLLYSEEYEKRKDDTSYFGKKGLNPALIPAIVAKAHQHNLRVSAHVATAHDFHVAVKAKVDEIAHLPEIHHGKPLAKKDVLLAKKNKTIVVTTVSLVKKRAKQPNYQALVDNICANLKLLKDAGVTLAIGSDMYSDNSVGEAQFLYDLKVFSNLELLKMWCENAAITTFPHRKIAYLKEGYEASFLVLSVNPIKEMNNVSQAIWLRIKQGVILGK